LILLDIMKVVCFVLHVLSYHDSPLTQAHHYYM